MTDKKTNIWDFAKSDSFTFLLIIGVVIIGISGLFGALDSKKPEIKTEVVLGIGSSEPETFVEFNGVKYFSHIDGVTVEKFTNK